MEDDDFGDLYTDIIIPTPTPASTSAPSNPAPAETLPRPPPNPNPTPAAAEAEDDDDWLLGGRDLIPGVDPTGDWADEDDDGGAATPPARREVSAPAKSPPAAEDLDPLIGGGVGDSEPAIPGLSSSAAAGAAGSDEWDSDSEDDIQIVLNETDGRRGLGEDEGDDEDGDDLVIVADGPHIPLMEEQDWGEDPTAAGAEGERKDGGEPGKAVAAPGGRIGYSGGSQGFHPQHHSMFKYVRPGASIGGASGAPGQFRPPGPPGSFSGRGRGDWRPAVGRGMNKSFHSGYGLDFTLPPHKTIFDIDMDTAFEEKPWKYPGADISDFFNFGLDEEKWKDFCKQLDLLRLESTMQSRIRVYESGRSEQVYDPDLPPELAAATGHPEISADNRNKIDNGHTDFSAQGRGPANMRTPVMTGRPIQVETGYGERLPSIDTRIPRMRGSDSVIEIVCQGHDPMADDTVDQTEKDSQGGNKGTHDVEDGKPYPSDKTNDSGHNSNLGKTEHKRRLPVSSEGDMLSLDTHAHSPPSYKTRGSPRGVRSLKGSLPGQNSSREFESSNEVIHRQTFSKRCRDSQRESETKGDSEGSPVAAADAADKLSTEDHLDDNDDRIPLLDSTEVDGDDATSDPNTPSETNEGDNLVHSSKKQKLIPMVEQPTGHNNSEQDESRALNSDNSKGRSGSSKDQQKRLESGEEVLQDRHSRRVNDVRRHHDVEERNLRRKDEYSRDVKPDVERSHLPPRGREDIHQPYANRDRVDIRGRSYDRARDTEIWPRREDSVHSRRAKEEDLRVEYNAEVGAGHRNKVRPIDRNDRDEDLHSRKRLDDGDWRSSRQRERGDMVLNRRESLDDSHIKRNKDDENLRRMKPENEDVMHGYRARDDHNRKKRERDDGNDQKRRDDSGRMLEKVDDRYHAKHKEDNWRQREREDRQRPKHENTLTLQREGRGTGRGGRIMDDKLVSGGRKKDEPRPSVLNKDTQERTRQNEPLRRGQGAEENSLKNKGRSDVHPRDDNSNNTERSRQEKPNNNRLSSSSDVRHAGRDRYRESRRKGRSSEPSEHDLHRSSKRRREDHERHRSGKVETKEASEQENSRDRGALSQKSQNPQPDNSFMKQVEEDAILDDENEDSRRGRSKLERWTSHKEIEYTNIDNETTETFPSIKVDVQTPTADELGKSEVCTAVGSSDIKSSGDTGQTSDKMTEEHDRHLDTVERLKRRSERFKLPMAGEEEAPQSKKMDAEVQPPQNESAAADMEVKPERPARKRRWTGS
ncbi:FIP1[V]-like protein isoform X2 [Phragmites australis]|uniref:FIP1[V]-like protein isoform X2 n=1 Tax=Phragmites australis TaxID=29695 RepID=UPI002D77BE47|nr:FIP1[V]-like protein isoform X2 [Phragmites australis]